MGRGGRENQGGRGGYQKEKSERGGVGEGGYKKGKSEREGGGEGANIPSSLDSNSDL